jgi:hypothetical protein
MFSERCLADENGFYQSGYRNEDEEGGLKIKVGMEIEEEICIEVKSCFM